MLRTMAYASHVVVMRLHNLCTDADHHFKIKVKKINFVPRTLAIYSIIW